MDPLTLTAQLNALLQAIQLPFVLESPVDLTPSLLLATLESILNVRIPIAHSHDDIDEDDVTSRQTRHVQTIKIFLGVLETDILQTDVGLSKLDPRLLAAGSWDEVVYVAEVLCWIGEELGLIQPPAPLLDKGKTRAEDVPAPGYVLSPSNVFTPSPSSTITFLPPFTETSPPPTPTTTTLLFAPDVDGTLHTNIASPLATSYLLHQLPNPAAEPRQGSSKPKPLYTTPPRTRIYSHRQSSSFSSSVRDIPPDDASFIRQTPPIRRTGQISLVDHDSELSAFLSQSSTTSSPPRNNNYPSPPLVLPDYIPLTPHARPNSKSKSDTSISEDGSTPRTPPRRSEEEQQDWRTLISTSPDHDPRRTYQLLQMRTELMEELLRLRMSRRTHF